MPFDPPSPTTPREKSVDNASLRPLIKSQDQDTAEKTQCCVHSFFKSIASLFSWIYNKICSLLNRFLIIIHIKSKPKSDPSAKTHNIAMQSFSRKGSSESTSSFDDDNEDIDDDDMLLEEPPEFPRALTSEYPNDSKTS